MERIRAGAKAGAFGPKITVGTIDRLRYYSARDLMMSGPLFAVIYPGFRKALDGDPSQINRAVTAALGVASPPSLEVKGLWEANASYMCNDSGPNSTIAASVRRAIEQSRMYPVRTVTMAVSDGCAAWPGKALVERAFSASLEAIRADPEKRLWGDRLIISRRVPGQPEKLEPPSVRTLPTAEGAPKGARLLLGSVIFHGRPDDGVAEVGYGVEESWQRIGVASEATRACVEWALAQEGIRAVTATTPPWHTASIRVLERAGLSKAGVEDHEILGEVLRFTRAR